MWAPLFGRSGIVMSTVRLLPESTNEGAYVQCVPSYEPRIVWPAVLTYEAQGLVVPPPPLLPLFVVLLLFATLVAGSMLTSPLLQPATPASAALAAMIVRRVVICGSPSE